MTKISLFWFDCSRCSKTFLSYVEGKPIYDEHECSCFFDEEMGAIHNNSYIYSIKGKRECRKCRKAVDLLLFCNPNDIQDNNNPMYRVDMNQVEKLTENENTIAVRIAMGETISDEDYEDYIESMFVEYD